MPLAGHVLWSFDLRLAATSSTETTRTSQTRRDSRLESARMNFAFQMQPQAEDPDGTAARVIAGVANVLKIEGKEDAVAQAKIVITFDDFLTAIVQALVAQQVARPAQFQVLTVGIGETVNRHGEPDAVPFAMPSLPAEIAAESQRAIRLSEL